MEAVIKQPIGLERLLPILQEWDAHLQWCKQCRRYMVSDVRRDPCDKGREILLQVFEL